MQREEFLKRFQFRNSDKLGEGGFGKVYKALDTERDLWVAIKVSPVADDKFSLRREIELSHDLTPHKNILHYKNSYRFEATPGYEIDYGTMEYIPDGNLSQLTRTKKLADKELKEIVRGILTGLAHLHQERCIHRDLKSANILMSRSKDNEWIPKISDLGLSRFTNQETAVSNSSIGMTYEFAAPEQFLNNKVNHQTDLWAIGVIIYELLTRELPFQAESTSTGEKRRVALYDAITNARLPARINQVPQPYQEIIRKCLVPDINKRVKSAEELLGILERKPIAESFSGKNPTELFEIPTEKKKQAVGDNFSVDVCLTQEELTYGTEKQVKVNRYQKCYNCNGTGRNNGSTCINCQGEARQLIPSTFSVKIPKGKNYGDVVRMKEAGSFPKGGGIYGSLFINLKPWAPDVLNDPSGREGGRLYVAEVKSNRWIEKFIPQSISRYLDKAFSSKWAKPLLLVMIVLSIGLYVNNIGWVNLQQRIAHYGNYNPYTVTQDYDYNTGEALLYA